MRIAQNKLTDLQLELLKIYSFNTDEEDLLHVKSILGKYFAHRLTRLVNKNVMQKGLKQKDIDQWLDEKKK